MKESDLKNGKVIKTPWLRIEEAAAYCGISKTKFVDSAKDVPHGGDPRTRLYHVKILDAWINNELNVPFSPEKKPKRRKSLNDDKEELMIVDPNNGKVYRSPKD